MIISFFDAIEKIDLAPPRVSEWNPPLCGDLDLTILANGQWLMEGRPITRSKLIQLYASVLKREEDSYYLVTPVEKWRITVEDSPFMIVDVTSQPLISSKGVQRESVSDIICRSNLGESLLISESHPLVVSPTPNDQDVLVPQILVRDDLWARFNRQSYYDLINLCKADDSGLLVTSGNYQQQLQF